jgi:Cu/Ag efflux pump CusA
MKRQKGIWTACVILVVIIVVLGYTPLMIPRGVTKPSFLGLPYSLWTSLLGTVVLVGLTFIGAKVHPGSDREEVEP